MDGPTHEVSAAHTEADRVAADLTYLSTQQQRQQERDRIAHQMDVDRMRHVGAI